MDKSYYNSKLQADLRSISESFEKHDSLCSSLVAGRRRLVQVEHLRRLQSYSLDPLSQRVCFVAPEELICSHMDILMTSWTSNKVVTSLQL